MLFKNNKQSFIHVRRQYVVGFQKMWEFNFRNNRELGDELISEQLNVCSLQTILQPQTLAIGEAIPLRKLDS